MAQAPQPLCILAQPKAELRERYSSEMSRERKRAHRYIRTDRKDVDYPTIAIPDIWKGRNIYIRVTLVTVPSEQAPIRCVHPYPIHTTDSNTLRDKETNTIYFLVSKEESDKGQKSFRIIREKLVHHDLKNIERLRIVDSNELDIQRVDVLGGARKLIDTYQLVNSQLLFSVAEMRNNLQTIIYHATSVYSNVMSPPTNAGNENNSIVRYTPQSGSWIGNDTIIMVIPKLDRRKPCEVYFEYSDTERDPVTLKYLDVKTIEFTTPPCRLPKTHNECVSVPIVVRQNKNTIACVNFLYQTSDRCVQCDRHAIFDSFERSRLDDQQSSIYETSYEENDIFEDYDDMSDYQKC
ncbi:hypothetical protein I4U23_026145 [Adineta vaga]|nr:hypothetical protein I4U23_026145 [Adineta vaga]